MNVDFSPKKLFQSNDGIRKELAIVVTSDNFHQALSFALAEFVMQYKPSAEQSSAVKQFINTLIYLPKEIQPPPSPPIKQLNVEAYEPIRPPTYSK